VNTSVAPEINVEQLMQRITEEIARGGGPAAGYPYGLSFPANADLNEVVTLLNKIVSAVRPPTLVRLSLPELQPAPVPTTPSAASKRDLHWKDLAASDGAAFVNAAYWAILGREADAEGLSCYRAMLRDGASKVEILGRICESPEAKQRNVTVVGLALAYNVDKARRWPILGRLISWVAALWNFQETERRYRQLACDLADRLDQREQDWARTRNEIYDALRTLEQSQNSFGDLTRLLASRNQVDAIQQALTRAIASIRSLEPGSDSDVVAGS
jgi:Domain of unknown function (DUF4214)